MQRLKKVAAGVTEPATTTPPQQPVMSKSLQRMMAVKGDVASKDVEMTPASGAGSTTTTSGSAKQRIFMKKTDLQDMAKKKVADSMRTLIAAKAPSSASSSTATNNPSNQSKKKDPYAFVPSNNQNLKKVVPQNVDLQTRIASIHNTAVKRSSVVSVAAVDAIPSKVQFKIVGGNLFEPEIELEKPAESHKVKFKETDDKFVLDPRKAGDFDVNPLQMNAPLEVDGQGWYDYHEEKIGSNDFLSIIAPEKTNDLETKLRTRKSSDINIINANNIRLRHNMTNEESSLPQSQFKQLQDDFERKRLIKEKLRNAKRSENQELAKMVDSKIQQKMIMNDKKELMLGAAESSKRRAEKEGGQVVGVKEGKFHTVEAVSTAFKPTKLLKQGVVDLTYDETAQDADIPSETKTTSISTQNTKMDEDEEEVRYVDDKEEKRTVNKEKDSTKKIKLALSKKQNDDVQMDVDTPVATKPGNKKKQEEEEEEEEDRFELKPVTTTSPEDLAVEFQDLSVVRKRKGPPPKIKKGVVDSESESEKVVQKISKAKPTTSVTARSTRASSASAINKKKETDQESDQESDHLKKKEGMIDESVISSSISSQNTTTEQQITSQIQPKHQKLRLVLKKSTNNPSISIENKVEATNISSFSSNIENNVEATSNAPPKIKLKLKSIKAIKEEILKKKLENESVPDSSNIIESASERTKIYSDARDAMEKMDGVWPSSFETEEIHESEIINEPEVVPAIHEPEVVPAIHEPEVVPEVVPEIHEPEVVPEIHEPEVVPEGVPEIHEPEVVPEVIPEIHEPEVVPEVIPEILESEVVLAIHEPEVVDESEATPEINELEVVPEVQEPEVVPEVVDVPEVVPEVQEPEVVPEVVDLPEVVPEVRESEVVPAIHEPEVVHEVQEPEVVPGILESEVVHESEVQESDEILGSEVVGEPDVTPDIHEPDVTPDIHELEVVPEVQESEVAPEVQESEVAPEVQEPEVVQELEVVQEPEVVDESEVVPEILEPEVIDETEVQVPEMVEEPEAINETKVQEPEMVDEPEVVPEVQEPEMVHEPEVQEPEVVDEPEVVPEVQEPEMVHEPEVQETEVVDEPKVQEPEVEPEVQETEVVDEPEVQETEVVDGAEVVQETEVVNEPEVQELEVVPEVVDEVEVVPEVVDEAEVVPEVVDKVGVVQELEVVQESEVVNEPEVIQEHVEIQKENEIIISCRDEKDIVAVSVVEAESENNMESLENDLKSLVEHVNIPICSLQQKIEEEDEDVRIISSSSDSQQPQTKKSGAKEQKNSQSNKQGDEDVRFITTSEEDLHANKRGGKGKGKAANNNGKRKKSGGGNAAKKAKNFTPSPVKPSPVKPSPSSNSSSSSTSSSSSSKSSKKSTSSFLLSPPSEPVTTIPVCSLNQKNMEAQASSSTLPTTTPSTSATNTPSAYQGSVASSENCQEGSGKAVVTKTELLKLKVDDLRKLAKANNLQKYSKLTKPQLVEALLEKGVSSLQY